MTDKEKIKDLEKDIEILKLKIRILELENPSITYTTPFNSAIVGGCPITLC